MYNLDKVREVESKLLFIYTYYCWIQVSFNEYLVTQIKENDHVSDKIADAKINIGDLRSLLFELAAIKYGTEVDYTAVTNNLSLLGKRVQVQKIHDHPQIWNMIINKIELGSFSCIFGHFISKLRELDKYFDKIKLTYDELVPEKSKGFEETLLELGNYLQEFTACLQTVKIMLSYNDTEKIIEKAAISNEFFVPIKEKPQLRIIK